MNKNTKVNWMATGRGEQSGLPTTHNLFMYVSNGLRKCAALSKLKKKKWQSNPSMFFIFALFGKLGKVVERW